MMEKRQHKWQGKMFPYHINQNLQLLRHSICRKERCTRITSKEVQITGRYSK